MFFLTKAAVKYLKKGSTIVTASVTTYKGSPHPLDYSSTKGAIVGFHAPFRRHWWTGNLGERCGAWTDLDPLFPSTFRAREVATFGSDVPMKRAAQPDEVATCFGYFPRTIRPI